MSISVGLDIAVRALLAQQQGADTVAHNIANVNTEGYSRQRLGLEAVPGPQSPYGSGAGPGRGVTSIGVERVRDMFADFQFRDGAQTSGRLDAQATFLQRAELLIGEPGDSGIRSVLSRYWNAWRDVATSPESSAGRTVLVQAGESLATTASRVHSSLTGLRRDANTALLGDVNQINALANEIYALNGDIQVIALRGGATNDLRDRRDLALDRLATLADINTVEQSDSRIDVFIGGHSLVSSSTAHVLYGDPNIANSNFVDLRFVEDNALLNVSDGELRGLLDMRDTDLVRRIADLNALMSEVITDVNAVHTVGFGLDALTGRAFFSGSDASDIAIDAGLIADPSTVAASTSATGVPGERRRQRPGDRRSAVLNAARRRPQYLRRVLRELHQRPRRGHSRDRGAARLPAAGEPPHPAGAGRHLRREPRRGDGAADALPACVRGRGAADLGHRRDARGADSWDALADDADQQHLDRIAPPRRDPALPAAPVRDAGAGGRAGCS